jgi:hypothetical protein
MWRIQDIMLGKTVFAGEGSGGGLEFGNKIGVEEE